MKDSDRVLSEILLDRSVFREEKQIITTKILQFFPAHIVKCNVLMEACLNVN